MEKGWGRFEGERNERMRGKNGISETDISESFSVTRS